MKQPVRCPGAFLDEFKGTLYNGEWPTIIEMFSITVARFPENRCMTMFTPDRETLTYAEAFEKVKCIAQMLVTKGIKAGDRVALYGKNTTEWALSYLGALYAGAVVVPLDNQLPMEDAEGLLTHSESSIFFIDEDRADKVNKSNTLLKDIIVFPKKTKDFLASLPTTPLEKIVPRKPEDWAALLYTSGTTGVAKGVMLSHKNVVSDVFSAQGKMDVLPTDVFYGLLPIYHSYTMTAVFMESMACGSELVFGKKLAIDSIMRDLNKGEITMFLGVPALYNKLILGIMNKIRAKGIVVYGIIKMLMAISGFVKNVFGVNIGKKLFGGILKQANLYNLRICICGGGPLPAKIFKMYNQLGLNFVQGYGLTETSPILTLNPIENYKNASVGAIILNVDMKIADPDASGSGEILVKGPMVMQGYYKNEEATKEVFTEDGYLKTGDVGYLDSDNYLYLTGRAKSLIVTDGGKNVFPEEIENKFQLYSEIEQILVRGFLKDAKMKIEGIEALFYPTAEWREKDLTPAQLHDHFANIVDEVNKTLVAYKRIQQFKVLDKEMEMTSKRTIKRHKVQ